MGPDCDADGPALLIYLGLHVGALRMFEFCSIILVEPAMVPGNMRGKLPLQQKLPRVKIHCEANGYTNHHV